WRGGSRETQVLAGWGECFVLLTTPHLRQPDWSAVRNDIAPAGVEAPEASGAGEFECAAEFISGNAAVDLAEAPLGLGFVRRIILVPHADVGVARKFLGEPVHDFSSVIEYAGHHEVAHKNPTKRQAILVHC